MQIRIHPRIQLEIGMLMKGEKKIQKQIEFGFKNLFL
jgi:hypothetical protein